MRKLALALTLAATTGLAPGLARAGGVPEVEPVVVCGNCGAPSSSGGLIVPLLLLLVIGAALAN